MSTRIPSAVLLVFAAGFPIGCSKPVAPATPAPSAPDAVFPTHRPTAIVENSAPAPTPASTPNGVQPRPNFEPPSAEERPASPAQLQAGYLAAKEMSDRIEIVYQLGNADSADALNVLMRLFQSEPDVQLKQEILDAADRVDGQLPAMLNLLSLALGPSQPADIRDAALSMLLGINDRRAIPNWQALLTDAAEDTRELARQQIEDLQLLPSE